MRRGRYAIRIEWGDCDAAEITFYPNYFRWFDAAAWHLFNDAGYESGRLMRESGIYLPIVEASARFHRPGWLGDEIVVESHVAQWRDRFFLVKHEVRRGEQLLLEGSELRCWAHAHPDDPQRMQALPIPDAFRAALD